MKKASKQIITTDKDVVFDRSQEPYLKSADQTHTKIDLGAGTADVYYPIVTIRRFQSR